MAIPSDVQHELGVLFGEIVSADANVLDLATSRRLVDGCRWVRSMSAAREAEFTAVYERLLRESPVHDAAGESGESSEAGPSSDPSGAPGPAPARPKDPPAPRESAKERSRRLLRAKWLQFCRRVADALAAGAISVEHVDVLAQILERTEPGIVAEVIADEAALVLRAQACTSEQFATRVLDAIASIRADGGTGELERQQADSRAWMTFDPVTGTYFFGVVLDPVRAPIFESAIRQRMNALSNMPGATAGLTEAKVRLQAMIDLVCGTAQVVPEAIVLVDERTVRTGPHSGTVAENVDGVRLPVQTVLDCCAAGKVTTAIVDATGRVVGSASCERVATTEQRRLLRAMYRTCAHPDCSVRFSACQIHHVERWEHGGPTSIANLIPLCYEHHHLVHEGGWVLTIDLDRTLTWVAPDGTTRRVALVPLLQQHAFPAVRHVVAASDEVGGAPPERGPPIATRSAAGSPADPPAGSTSAGAPQAQLFDPHAA